MVMNGEERFGRRWPWFISK